MKIANQLFDRSALNTSKKDAKISIDKQGAGTANASIARKVNSTKSNVDEFSDFFAY